MEGGSTAAAARAGSRAKACLSEARIAEGRISPRDRELLPARGKMQD